MASSLYGWPVRKEDLECISFDESPIHKAIVKLRHSCDLLVPLKSPVFAMASGEVTYVKNDSKIGGNDLDLVARVEDSKFYNEGNRIEINHGDNEFSAYEHLAYLGVFVAVGDNVKKGDKIAITGYTGLMAHLGPHLHVERFRFIGSGNDNYITLPIHWENEEDLLKFIWGHDKWLKIGKSRELKNG